MKSKRSITEYYSSKSNLELSKCMLRVECYKKSFGAYVDVSYTPDYIGLSCDIINKGDKRIGSFDLHSMSDPNSCCNIGGWTIFLVSKFSTTKCVDDVCPVFIVVDRNDTRVPPIRAEYQWTSFNPIEKTKVEIHNGTFSFKVPRQNDEIVGRMKNSGKELKLALYRSSDGSYSSRRFAFYYYQHFEACSYCNIRCTRSAMISEYQQDDTRDTKNTTNSEILEDVSELGTVNFNMSDDDTSDEGKMEMDCGLEGNEMETRGSEIRKIPVNTEPENSDKYIYISKDGWDGGTTIAIEPNMNSDEYSCDEYPSSSDDDCSANESTSDDVEDGYGCAQRKIIHTTIKLDERENDDPLETLPCDVPDRRDGDHNTGYRPSTIKSDMTSNVAAFSTTVTYPPVNNENIDSTSLNKNINFSNKKEIPSLTIPSIHIIGVIMFIILRWLLGFSQ